MKAEKIITTTERVDIDIREITLLSKEEYMEDKGDIQTYAGLWWLRSPNEGNGAWADLVYNDGYVDGQVVYSDCAVRPALRVSNLETSNLQIGDKINLAGRQWTVISENIILCDESIGDCPFRKDWKAEDANVYAASDIKKFVDAWAKKNGLTQAAKQSQLDEAKRQEAEWAREWARDLITTGRESLI